MMDNKEDETLLFFMDEFYMEFKKRHAMYLSPSYGVSTPRTRYAAMYHELKDSLYQHNALPMVLLPETVSTLITRFETQQCPTARAVFTDLYAANIKRKLMK